jgi:hypothetical protein
MAVLTTARLLAAALPTLLAAPACYSPELADCAVSCTAAEDCAPGQRCGADGLCAGDERAGRCDGSQAGDDGELPADSVQLRLTIAGRGQVELDVADLDLAADLAPDLRRAAPDHPTCVAAQPSGVTCSYRFPAGTWLTLRMKESGGWQFAGWDAPGCGPGRPRSCLVLLRPAGAPTFVTARFDAKDLAAR